MISYKFDIPYIVLGVMYNFVNGRIPVSPATVSMPVPGFSFTDNMTFWERVKNTFLFALLYFNVPFVDDNIAER